MKEYKIIYREGETYKIMDKIYDEDTAYVILTMLIKVGYTDSRIEYNEI